jgi:Ca2+-binding EF-hand superfamily protein
MRLRLGQDEIDYLHEVFKKTCSLSYGRVDERAIYRFLSDFGVDAEFTPAIARILSTQSPDMVFDRLIAFFQILASGSAYQFHRMMFSLMDSDNDNLVHARDLVNFGSLINSDLSEAEADQLIRACRPKQEGAMDFSEFWHWYKEEHGIDLNFDDADDPHRM